MDPHGGGCRFQSVHALCQEGGDETGQHVTAAAFRQAIVTGGVQVSSAVGAGHDGAMAF